ncbi:hypothetical protein [Methylomonas koyamae]|uniref:hypothetical protein n=1 Tax=Methylomonas koyamae TaxID=702114 RepID=UPI0012F629B4|nr:hypothetical protein [Methylomonas koyamae]
MRHGGFQAFQLGFQTGLFVEPGRFLGFQRLLFLAELADQPWAFLIASPPGTAALGSASLVSMPANSSSRHNAGHKSSARVVA